MITVPPIEINISNAIGVYFRRDFLASVFRFRRYTAFGVKPISFKIKLLSLLVQRHDDCPMTNEETAETRIDISNVIVGTDG